ncbi:hypothetical protein IscW_ISCW021996 [Ixodes scapularis]|uniref:Uncharacterized protein n=1 Tax=Ixodes scapularis TaxID=6945 RepID=B7QE14_IXOSC|nr:hypothetical protein IscW_ISCW021996 [Ixodes scapularis]|eukprot:XP_002413778.1 hypothetical protein IscW_ISCW021996 [Ixodes scapularis]
MAQLGPLVDEAINQVAPEKWEHFVPHVVDEEAALRKVDHVMDDVFHGQEPAVIAMDVPFSEWDTDSSDDDLGC